MVYKKLQLPLSNDALERFRKKAVQEKAFRELLSLRLRNGAKPVPNDIRHLVQEYEMLGVTRQNLHYQWRKYLASKYDDNGIIGLDICFPSHTSASDVSPLTEPEECITAPIERPNKNIMMKRALEEENALNYNLTTLASERFQEKRNEARANGQDVAKKCLRDIIQEIEAEHDLPENTLNYEHVQQSLPKRLRSMFKLTAESVARNSFCVNTMDLSAMTKLHSNNN
jgi:tRNA(Glu) U13 pseudouridine synthase TruD